MDRIALREVQPEVGRIANERRQHNPSPSGRGQQGTRFGALLPRKGRGLRSLPIVSLALLAFAGSAFAASPPEQTPYAGRAAALLTSTPEGFNRYRAYVRVLRKLAAGWQRAHPTLAALVLIAPELPISA